MRIRFLRRAGGHVVVAVLLAGRRDLQVAGQDLPGYGVDGYARDARDDLGRIARVVRLHQLEDTARILQSHVAFREAGRAGGWTLSARVRLAGVGRRGRFVGPRRDVVRPLRRVVAREQAVLEREPLFDDERRVGVVAHVGVVEQVVLQDVIDQAAEVSDIGARAHAQIYVGHGG